MNPAGIPLLFAEKLISIKFLVSSIQQSDKVMTEEEYTYMGCTCKCRRCFFFYKIICCFCFGFCHFRDAILKNLNLGDVQLPSQP